MVLELGMPATVLTGYQEEGGYMAAVMIGVDPHKASHTAVAINAAEEPQDELRVRACAGQAQRLLAWAAAWPERTWAIEGAGGLGHLLAQQLLAAGERVLDVQPKLGARVRLLATGAVNKNDPNDARSVAIAALRSPARRQVTADDHAAVLKVWSKRHRDLGRTRTQVACRLHAAGCELIPGGVSKRITAGQGAQILTSITPQNAVEAARCELAADFAEDLRGIDAAMRDTKHKLTAAVQAAGTTVTEVFGVGPGIAATVIAGVRDISRFPAGTTSPPTTAPRRSRCPLASARSTGCRGAATGGSTTPSTWPRSARSATATVPAAPTSTRSWPKARPPKKPCAP
jgi:transposase